MAKKGYGVINSNTKKLKKGYGVIGGVTRKLKKAYAVVNGKTQVCWSADRILGFGYDAPYPIYEMEIPTDVGTVLGNTPERISSADSVAKWNGKYWIVANGNLYYSEEATSWTQFTATSLPSGLLKRVYNGGTHLLVTGYGYLSGLGSMEGFACIIDTDGTCRTKIFDYSSDMTTEVESVTMNDSGTYAVVVFRSNGRNALTLQWHIGYYTSTGNGYIDYTSTGGNTYAKGIYGGGKFVLPRVYPSGDGVYIGYGTSYNLTSKEIYSGGSSATALGYFNGKFYLRSNDGKILSASDPSGTWTANASPGITKVLVCGSTMYGFYGSTMAYTNNGTVWIQPSVSTVQRPNDMLYFDEA